MNEETPEVEDKEEKETFGCWVCDERMGFKKLVSHLRNHSQTEKMLAYTTQVTQERKERDGKNGKARRASSHLPQENAAVLGKADPADSNELESAKVLDSPDGRRDDLPDLPNAVEAGDLEPAKAASSAASIANL